MQSHALPINLTAASLEKYLIYKGHARFLSYAFQLPLRAVSLARGPLLWHGLANFSTTEEEIVPPVAAASCGPTAAGRAVEAALNRENNSTVIPVFTQYLLHLCNCQYLPCSCIYPIAMFLSAPAPTLFMSSFLFSCTTYPNYFCVSSLQTLLIVCLTPGPP